MMKKRPDGFLAEENISHNSEVFDYIKELHGYMWDIVNYLDCNVSMHLYKCWDKVTKKIKKV